MLTLVRAAALAACAALVLQRACAEGAGADEDDDDVQEWISVDAAPQEPAEFNPMVQLTDDTILPFVKENAAVLVEFYAPWCGMCKMVGPEYQRAAWIAHNKSLPFKVAQLNADKYTVAADALRINKYPTVYLYRNGVPEPFPVLSVAEAYVAGAARMLDAPGAHALSPVKHFPAEADVADVAGWLFWRGTPGGAIATTMVLYYPPGLTGSAAVSAGKVLSALETAASSMFKDPNIRFALIQDREVLEAFEVPLDRPTLVLYKEHDEGRVEFDLPADGAVKPSAIEAWAKVHQVPLVTIVTHKNLQAYRAKVSHLGLFFTDGPAVEHKATAARLQAKLLSIAEELVKSGVVTRGKFTLALADGKKYGSWMGHYGMREGQFPAMGLEDTASEALWSLPDIVEEASCHPPAEAAAPPAPLPGTQAYEELPDGYDLMAPYREVDGRTMHTAPWCPGGGSFKATRKTLAEAAAQLEKDEAAAAAASVAVDAAGNQGKVAKPTPYPPGYVPTFEEGFTHNEATVQRKLMNDKRAAEGLPPLPESLDTPLTGGLSDEIMPPLYWVDVPTDSVAGWLKGVLSGAVKPNKAPKKVAGAAMYAALGGVGGSASGGAGAGTTGGDDVGTLHDMGGSERALPA